MTAIRYTDRYISAFRRFSPETTRAANPCGSFRCLSAPCRTRTYNPLIKSLIGGLLDPTTYYENRVIPWVLRMLVSSRIVPIQRRLWKPYGNRDKASRLIPSGKK